MRIGDMVWYWLTDGKYLPAVVTNTLDTGVNLVVFTENTEMPTLVKFDIPAGRKPGHYTHRRKNYATT